MSETPTIWTPSQYKTQGYAIFILQELQKEGLIVDDFDPYSLGMERLLQYDAPEIVSQLKKRLKKEKKQLDKRKGTGTVTAAPKPDIIAGIVNAFYDLEK